MYFYSAFGLHIESPWLLPELAPGTAPADVKIRVGKLAHERPATFSDAWIEEDKIFLYWADIGLFCVADGQSIDFDPASNSSPQRQRLFLLGAAFGVLLQQRHMLALHASAVHLPRGAVAFLGQKGMGKSTLVAALVELGVPFLTDDILALDFEPRLPERTNGLASHTRKILAYPGPRQIKLWPNSLQALGRDKAVYARLHPDYEKREYQIDHPISGPRPLLAVIILGYSETLSMGSVAPQDGWQFLLANWYGGRYNRQVHQALGQERVLRQVAEIVQQVPIYHLNRPDDLTLLDRTIQLIEEKLFERDDLRRF